MAICPNYNQKCGGCPLLAIPYPEQLTQKQVYVKNLLGSFARVDPILGAKDPFHYRNKAIASFSSRQGKLVCGLYAAGTHSVLPHTNCLLQMEIVNQTLNAILSAAHACRWQAYDEDRNVGLLRYTVLRAAQDGHVLVTLVTPNTQLPGSRNFCAALHRTAPWVVGVIQNCNPTTTSAVLGNQERVLWGNPYVLDTLCGLKFAVSSRSFYQIHHLQTEVLYAQALQMANLTGSETVIDAYCGIGTIGLCASQHVKEVIGVELNTAAVRDAIGNAKRNHIANAHFVCADATDWMLIAAGTVHPDVVFLDPPRAGSTPECIAAIAKMKPSRIVYISCNPETLARDAKNFTQRGYQAKKFIPVDLFPHTNHTEVIALFTRK